MKISLNSCEMYIMLWNSMLTMSEWLSRCWLLKGGKNHLILWTMIITISSIILKTDKKKWCSNNYPCKKNSNITKKQNNLFLYPVGSFYLILDNMLVYLNQQNIFSLNVVHHRYRSFVIKFIYFDSFYFLIVSLIILFSCILDFNLFFS